jgi:AcrR family transcriptional regulator
MTRPRFTIGELVARTGVPRATVHHYLTIGLLPPPEPVAANRFLYDERHVRALRLVRLLRERRRLPLRAIRNVLPDLMGEDEEAFRPDAWEMALPDEDRAGREIRGRLLRVAIAKFSSPGYAHVTMNDVAEAAGLAKGTVYRYFPSKDDLFVAAVRHAVDEVLVEFRGQVARAGGPVDVDTAAKILGDAVRPAMPLLFDLGAQALQGHAGRVIAARGVLDTLLSGIGGETRGRAQPRERAARVIQSVIADAFRGVVPAFEDPLRPADSPDSRRD